MSAEPFLKVESSWEAGSCKGPLPSDTDRVLSDGEYEAVADDSDDDIEVIPDLEGVQVEFRDRIEAVLKGSCKTYYPNRETLPALSAYHPSFAIVQQYCGELIDEAARVFQSSGYRDSFVEQLLEEIRGKRTIKFPQAQTVGVIGDSGAGKSSLINALLNTPGLAAKGADTSACTCVVTLFRQASPNQKTPFMATVELYELEVIHNMLREYLKAFFELNCQPYDHLDQTELEECQKEAETAFTALFALFMDRPEFANEDSATEFLQTARSADDEKMLEKLSSWVQELLRKGCDPDGMIRIYTDSAEDMAQGLERFVTSIANSMDDNDIPVPSYWPIVRIVTVGLDAPLLKRGLELADLPGTSDSNRTRTKVARDYVRKCTYYMVVAPVLRVLTEDSVREKLLHGITINRYQKILVLTKLDDNLSVTSKPRSVGTTAEVAEEIDRLSKASRAVTILQNKKRDRSNRLDDGQAWKEFHLRMQRLSGHKRAYDALIREVLMSSKVEQTRSSLHKKYSAWISKSRGYKVFGVSNLDYEKRVEGNFGGEDIPLSIELTGIPKLREHMSSLPASQRVSVLKHYVDGHLQSLVSNMETWGSQATLKRRDELREVVAKACEKVDGEIDSLIANLMSHAVKRILDPMEKAQSAWITHGIRGFERWEKLPPVTFGAWCRKNGVHRSPKLPYPDWNVYLLEPIKKDIDVFWSGFDKIIELCRDKCFVVLDRLRCSISLDLNNLDGVSVVPMTPFLQSLIPKKEELRHALKAFSEEVMEISKNARLDTILLEDEGHLMMAMNPLYERCKNIPNGKGVNAQKKSIIREAIIRGEPYLQILPGVRSAIMDGLQQEKIKLLTEVKRIFAAILQSFDLTFVLEELPNKERDKLRQRALDFAKTAQKKMDGDIAMHMAMADGASSDGS